MGAKERPVEDALLLLLAAARCDPSAISYRRVALAYATLGLYDRALLFWDIAEEFLTSNHPSSQCGENRRLDSTRAARALPSPYFLQRMPYLDMSRFCKSSSWMTCDSTKASLD